MANLSPTRDLGIKYTDKFSYITLTYRYPTIVYKMNEITTKG
jgi:hypothetical protein